MTSSKFDAIQKLLTEYSLEREDTSTNEDLLCILCHRIMVDACESTCGCHYCHMCIATYLSKDNNLCPGVKSECKEDRLSLESDVFRNIRLTARISKMVVTCPNVTCNYKTELSQLQEHLNVCGKESLKCPCTVIGCEEGSVSKDEMTRHLSNQAMCHTQLMTSFMIDLRNEVTFLKEMFQIVKVEISLLKEDFKFKEILNEEKQREMDFLMEELRNKDNMFTVFDQEFKSLKNEIIPAMSSKEKEAEKINAQMEAYGRELEAIKEELERMEWTNMKIQMNDLKREISEIKMNVEASNEDRERRMNNLIRMNKLCPNVDMDFMWRIEEYSRKRKTVTDVYSDSFHSHNYKFCLNLYIYGDNIGLWCVIMKGEKDDFLEWPLRRTVTLSIVEQETLKPHKTTCFQYDTYQRNKKAFDRPKDERNDYCIGTDSLVRYSYIKDTPLILVNDSIVVTCVVR